MPDDDTIFADDEQRARVADCEICRQLRDREDDCVKARDDAQLLPPAAARLVTVPGAEMGRLEKCPLCGTYYSYSHFFDYTPCGIDEEAHLRRLPPAETLSALIADALHGELATLARRHPVHARRVLVAINRSRLDRKDPRFARLQSLCQSLRPPAVAPRRRAPARPRSGGDGR